MAKEAKLPEKAGFPLASQPAPQAPTPEPEKAKEAPASQDPGWSVPGGRYIVDGVLVDCNGKPIKE